MRPSHACSCRRRPTHRTICRWRAINWIVTSPRRAFGQKWRRHHRRSDRLLLMYLACVMDLFSRMIVGWAMGDSLAGELVNTRLVDGDAANRNPPPGLPGQHLDRGCQYAAGVYRALLCKHGITPSMSRVRLLLRQRGDGELLRNLKRELIHRTTYATAQQAESAIFEYIEAFYNRQRRHSSLGYLSPQAFEAQIN